MREKTVEQKLVRAVKAAGGICPKWVAPGFDSAGIRWDAGQDRAFTGWEDGICGSKGSGEEGEAIAEVKA